VHGCWRELADGVKDENGGALAQLLGGFPGDVPAASFKAIGGPITPDKRTTTG
jgi:hypothetical protein